MISRIFLFASFLVLFSAVSLEMAAENREKEKKQDIFSCKHCDLMMSVVDPNQKCDVCRCDKTASECKGE